MGRTMVKVSAGCIAVLAAVTAMGAGPDVTLQTITNATNYGLVGNVRGYIYDSNTCNIGGANLTWANGGTPAYANNLFRITNGRIQQIGLSFCKMACCAAAGSGCGTCNGSGGNVLGAGCKDVYSSGWNGGQTRLAARSAINGYTGAVSTYNTASGDAIFKRLQVAQTDLSTTTFPNSVFIAEGLYVATDEDHAGGAGLNNNTYRPVTIDQSAFNMTFVGTAVVGMPAIYAWHDHGNGLNSPDNNVQVQIVQVPGEGRFYVGSRVAPIGNTGRYRYDYAIYNLNSDRSAQSLSIPVFAGVNVTNIGFSDVNYHSGEPFANTDWAGTHGASDVSWGSQTFSENSNANAIRWGTMYNFWFEADSAPTTRDASIGLFKPGTPTSVTFSVRVPSCRADFNTDNVADLFDYLDYVQTFQAGDMAADFDHSGTLDLFDYLDFVDSFSTGC